MCVGASLRFLFVNICSRYEGGFWDSRSVIIKSEIRQFKFNEENFMLGFIVLMLVFYAPLRVIVNLAEKYK